MLGPEFEPRFVGSVPNVSVLQTHGPSFTTFSLCQEADLFELQEWANRRSQKETPGKKGIEGK